MKRMCAFLACVILVLGCVAANSAEQSNTASKEDLKVFSILKEELKRSMSELVAKGSIKPYFISYTLLDSDIGTVDSSYGALYGSTRLNARKILIEIRVGNYAYDNTDINNPMARKISSFVPVEHDEDSLKKDLWYQTNLAYEYAVKLYYYKKQQLSDEPKKETNVDSFSHESPAVYYDKVINYDFDVPKIERELKNASKFFRKYPQIQFDVVKCNFGAEKRYFVNSEGSEIFSSSALVDLSINARTQADDGTELSHSAALYYDLEFQPVNFKDLEKQIKTVAEELLALKNAPTVAPQTGPAILSPQAVGVLFHEAIGHRLEGERQESKDEGQTFKKSLNQKVIPEFLNVYDDPTQFKFLNAYLNGFYRFDDEGIKAQRVDLIENGILKNFLMSRTPIEGFNKSNGHGRANMDFSPIARMSNLFVKSSKEYDSSKLKKLLLNECKRQKKPYGFIIESMMGGETQTLVGSFQVFKSVPQMIYRVDANTGKEELVRGMEIVGTPLSSVNKIILTGNDYEVKNGYCSAESGWVRVATIAPSALISEIELQNKRTVKKQLPIISRP